MEASNTQPDIPELPLGGFVPGSSAAIQVRSIEGLGPVKGAVSSTPYATGRGALFQGIAIETRNIVLTLGLNPDWEDQSMTSLRRLLYRYFMTGLWVRLRFLCDDMDPVYINGISESFEPNIFAQDPEIQVSIICNKPDFIDEATTLIESETLDIASVDFNGITYESMTDPNITDLDYIGTAPAGFEVIIEEPYTGTLAFVNATPDGVQYLEMEAVVIDGIQRFHLNTVRSTRYVRNVNIITGAAVNILAKMTKESDWPEFSPGANRFAVYSTGGGLAWTLGYLVRYGGL
jgi:hypothetical protein